VNSLFGLKDPVVSNIYLDFPQPPPLTGGSTNTNSRIQATSDIKLTVGSYGVTASKSTGELVVLYPWNRIARVIFDGKH